MQAGGQYGVSEVQQFMVGRAGSGGHAAAAAHIFSLSHDVGAAVSPSSHSHSHPSQQQHHHQSHHQQHQSHQQQAHHQTAAASQTALQQQQQQQHHQQQMMQHQQQQQQQLGLDPDSPDLPSPIATTRQSPNSYSKQLIAARDSLAADEEGMEEGDRGTGGNRWPRQETLALIKIRTDMDASFRDAGLKGPLWEEVSRKLAELGFHRNAKKCKEKFENVHKYYKKTKEGKAGRQDGKSYRFFSQLEALYGGTSTGSMHMSASKGGGGSGGFGNTIPKGGGGGMSAQRYADQDDEFNISSESSGDEYDDPAAEDEPPESRKRKRKASWSSSETAFFEGLVRKMIDKQEAMHRKFLEGIERREQERLIREDAWKRQEMARISREQELRAQERSLAATRDAALVAFLQKVTGQTLQLPHIPPQPSSKPQQALSDDQADKEPIDPNSKRWPKSEVLSLIRLRSGMEAKFQESGPKGSLWEAISAAMASLGYSRSPKRCKEKWENINKYFRKTKESSKKRPENAKTCPYFHQLDTLYRTGVLNSPSSKALKMEDQTNEMMGHHNHHLGREEDSGQAQDEEEMLGGLIPSSGESAPNGIVLNSSSSTVAAAAAIFSGQENGSNADRSDNGTAVAKMMNQKQPQLVDDGSGSGGNIGFERFPGVHEKQQPLKQQLEGLVKEMMMEQQQQQQQQQSGDGYEMRLDQAQQADNTSSHADQWQQQQQQQQQQQEHLKLRSTRPNPKDAALIALVHKLAGQAPDYPSISD